jgi:hypothetical protein
MAASSIGHNVKIAEQLVGLDPKLLNDLERLSILCSENGFHAWKVSDSFEWGKMDIQLPLVKIEEVAKKYGVIPLRPVDYGCRTLIIGCGKRPLANAGGYPDWNHSMSGHSHQGAVTIDAYLPMNPDIVGFFGARYFPMLKDRQFLTIIFEGMDPVFSTHSLSELSRLLAPGGKVYLNFGDERCYPLNISDFRLTGESVVLPKEIYSRN